MSRSPIIEEHLAKSAEILAQSMSALERLWESMRGDWSIERTSLQQIAETRALLQRAWLPEGSKDGGDS